MAKNGCIEFMSLDTSKGAKSRPPKKNKKQKKQLRIATDLMEIVMMIVVTGSFRPAKLIV